MAFTECLPDMFPQAVLPSVVLKSIHYGCLGANLLELITKCSWRITQSGIIGFNFSKKKKKIQPVALLNQKQRRDGNLDFTSGLKE